MPHGRHLIGRAERENRHHLRQARCLVLHRVVGCGCFLLPNHAFFRDRFREDRAVGQGRKTRPSGLYGGTGTFMQKLTVGSLLDLQKVLPGRRQALAGRVEQIPRAGNGGLPCDQREKFWNDNARNLFLGLVLYLMETPDLHHVGLVLDAGRPLQCCQRMC
jgi:hypothetical protein